jgi:hypothetical protein
MEGVTRGDLARLSRSRPVASRTGLMELLGHDHADVR